MNLVIAPSRVAKSYSFWILIVLMVIDAGSGLMVVLDKEHLISAPFLTIANFVLGFAATMAKFVQQNLAMTQEQKSDAIERIQDAPTKPPKVPEEISPKDPGHTAGNVPPPEVPS